MGEVRIKRVYEAADKADGFRVLVDRLWPRGLSKAKAGLDLWLKEVAPSADLRRWWHHDPERFDQFAQRYQAELDANPQAVGQLLDLASSQPTLTLLYGAKDKELNQAIVLRAYLERRLG
ncbi:hypothetical protein BACT_0999 [Bifidobacterium actinocoloniiforme DSM 22766]|uniref:Uroporphyrin-III C-methyltransferase n=1 Tax=Bifidobacterium actinocoloniiforme DSM 22766 TaxID=1437605 RepID=A0A086Z197_9BIFI|nr:DUF488 domain-containing protein [Bifidobacterium actinocoloniiforme]AKV55459.1 hypothetical protein AB656_03605 [Bifidobacterium actinocoloniiforme DSM 22766]KFI40297.1 hypothetical protein BACT_0999 [Bifidobacterium actinocoloniiforme DSM 22766]